MRIVSTALQHLLLGFLTLTINVICVVCLIDVTLPTIPNPITLTIHLHILLTISITLTLTLILSFLMLLLDPMIDANATVTNRLVVAATAITATITTTVYHH